MRFIKILKLDGILQFDVNGGSMYDFHRRYGRSISLYSIKWHQTYLEKR